MAKFFKYQGRFVTCTCRAFDYVAYRVEDQEKREIRVYDDGRITRGAGGIDLAQADRDAVLAYRENDKREFKEWLAQRPDLAEAYAALSNK